jgi:peptidoglycan hydrolase-like protein with peptidoglycan-binding domain
MIAPAPQLSFGDTGEWVLRLQTRLQALGLFDGVLDGTFGEITKLAVTRLQQEHGLPADGAVGEQTWAALAAAEAKAGLREDHQWRWDGHQWQRNDQVMVAGAGPDEGVASHPSTDGHWVWDGKQWQPVTDGGIT